MTEPLTQQDVTLAKECGALGPETTEDVEAILVRLHPGFDVATFRRVAGGRLWYVPSPRVEERAKIREAVLSDPSGDVKEVARRHQVSISTVYFWRNQG